MFREGLRPPDPFREQHPFAAARTQDGMNLAALSRLSPVLVVCLPAWGSAAARAMLGELVTERSGIEAKGVRVVLVHMGTDEEAAAALAPHDLHYVARIADPERRLYAALELEEAAPGVLGRLAGRGAVQLAGAFRLEGGEVRRSFRARKPGERPDYGALV